MATCPDRARDDGPRRDAVSWRTTLLPAAGHVVPVRVLVPAQPSGWLVWAHGGSWSRGSAEHWHAPCADVAVRSSCVVVSVDYRLSPRHQHPAPLDDVLTAMAWARQQMAEEGTPPALLSVGGDSAGGTLAACAALAWRDLGHDLAAQVLAYPPLDPSCGAASYATPGQFPERSTMRAAWAAHLGSRAADGPGAARYRSPLDAETLEGVAPAILAVGDLDPVRDDVSAYAGRLHEADVHVAHQVFTDTAHGAFLSADQREPALRGWLASTLRHQLDRGPSSRAPHHPIGAG